MSLSAALAVDDEESALHEFVQRMPPDWPAPGPIDLNVQDLPHASSTLEWWYVNTHLKTESGRELSLFAAFFRQARGRDAEGTGFEYSHSVTWALSDPAERRYRPKVAVDATAPALGLAKLDASGGLADRRVDRAMREVLERGRIPGPTQLFTSRPLVADDRLELDFGGSRLSKDGAGRYVLELHDVEERITCRLVLKPLKPATRYGNDGVVHGVADERMFYYFIPRCEVTGTLRLGERRERIVDGQGWYDHEFGFTPTAPGPSRSFREKGGETSWRWLSLQLDDGTDVSVFLIARRRSGELLDNWTVVVGPDGTRREFRDARLETTATWRSTRSFVEYPIAFRLDLPQAGLDLEVKADFPDQEVLTVISDPGFWEGRVSVSGSLSGRSVAGKGWVECKGFRFDDVGSFFEAVGGEVRKRVAELLATKPSREELSHWVVRGDAAGRDTASYVEGVGPDDVVNSLVRPIREIVDRGGKGWRSYAALACIDVVGGDSRKFLHWLPIPELLHVGSLIVDDVQDESAVRRGGASCHELFGVPRAINAGTAAYFLAEPPVTGDLPAESQLRIYRLYFDAMRAGHTGQAIDLHGFEQLALETVRTGGLDALEGRVLAMHRLKTAAPAGMLARIGAILGGGTEQQIEELGRFFESVGLAFQIMDDVLNLRGFKGDLKQRGEDVTQGKITLPIAKALAVPSRAEREWLWRALRAKSSDAAVVASVIDAVERCGALAACEDLARSLVDGAWERLDPTLPESQFKLMFRAFSWYVLDRHY